MYYGLIYVFILLPLKLWACLTIYKFNWGTSNRKEKYDKDTIDLLPIIMWILVILVGSILTFIYDSENLKKTYLQNILISLVSLFGFMNIMYLCFKKWILKISF